MSEGSEGGLDTARWQRLSTLFDDLVNLDVDEREERIASLEEADPDLVEELQRLLDSDARTNATLDGDWREALTGSPAGSAGAQSVAGEMGDRTGECIDAYQLVRRVGRGGMGEVYLAERKGDDFVQQVALKLLRRGVDTEDVIRRFVQERSILARLEHPGIARLIDGGIAADGLPYLVMEYVDGEALNAYVRAHDPDLEARLRLLIAVCEAVDFAHRRLVVHRDLKPSNVLVTADGSVKLLDFGIAKLLDAGSDSEALTGTGMRVLSPAYAAPEQFLGEPIGTATDVYALGVILFELLTGELPHKRGSRSLNVLTQEVTHECVEKPSAVLRRRAQGETSRRARAIDGDLDTIVLTALKREPERRYASAAALAQDLRACLEGRPIAAHPDTFGYRTAKFVRRNRLAVSSASVVLIAILAGFAIALWQTGVAQAEARRADAEAQRATSEARRAGEQLALADRTRAFVVNLFQGMSPTVARDGSALTAEDFVRGGIAMLDTELADAPLARVELRATLAGALQGLGNHTEAIPELERAMAELEALGEGVSSNMASTLNMLAVAHMRTQNIEAAEIHARKGLAIFEGLEGDYRVEKIKMRTVLGNAALTRGDTGAALAIYLANLKDRLEHFGPEAVEAAVDYNNLSAAYGALDRPLDAERAARKVLALLRSSPDSPRARQSWAMLAIARNLFAQGRFNEAAAMYEEERSNNESTLPPAHPMHGSVHSGLARVALAKGDFEKGYELFARAAPIYAAADDKDIGLDALSWGLGLLEQQRNAEAESKLASAVARLEETHGGKSPYTLQAHVGLALARARRGFVEEGFREAAAAMAAFEPDGMHRGTVYAESAIAYAGTLERAGRAGEAAQWRDRGRALLLSLLGPDHPRIARLSALPD